MSAPCLRLSLAFSLPSNAGGVMSPEIEQRMKSAKWGFSSHYSNPLTEVWEREHWYIEFAQISQGFCVWFTTNPHDHNAGITGTDPFDTLEEAFESFLQLPMLETTVSGLTGIR